MAYPVSNKFREKVYSGESLYLCNLKISNNPVLISQIQSIKISSPIIDTNASTFYIGSFISQAITIKFKNLDGLDIKSGNEVTLDIGREIDGSIEYVPIGKYLIDDLGQDYQKTCEITCLDYAIKFKPNIDYSSQFDSDGLIEIDTLLEYICQYFNVEIGSYPSINGNIRIGTYDNTVSGKQYISYIAELKGCNAKIGRDGKLYLIPVKSEPVVTINALESKSWELKEKYEISKVIYEDAIRKFEFGGESEYDINYPSEEIYPSEELYPTENGSSKGNTLFIRTDNMFIVDGSVVENIYNVLKDFKVYSLKCENYGDVSLDAWDIIRYQLGEDENGEPIYYDTFNDNLITYEMTIMSTVDVKIPTAQQESLVNNVSGDDSTKLKIMRTTINQLTGEIELLTRETTDIKDNVNENYYTIDQTEKLLLNSKEGLTNTFSEAGGNNIFRNTGLWFENGNDDKENNPYEFWTGPADKGRNDKSVSGNSIILKNNIFSQEQDVPNGNYAISFYYRKTNPLANASVKINDIEYPLDSEEWKQFYTGEQDQDGNYIVQPIEVSAGHLRIDFICSINGAVEVYDIMANKGSVKLAWSQNQNETTTDTVNISKGITITSSDTESVFKANADGIRVLDKNNNKTTWFTDKGTSTKELIVEKQAQITGLLEMEVDDQTWMTRM